METVQYNIPKPILNKRELAEISKLTETYKKLTEPGIISKAGVKVISLVPEKVKGRVEETSESIKETKLFQQCMKILADGFDVVEKNAAKFTVNENTIIKKVDAVTKGNEISSIEEICLARSYSISRLVESRKSKERLSAAIEGMTTGALGLVGLPFNIVLSMFLYYRAVQSIAMFYGYDVKNDPAELMIAGEVFANALSPKKKGTDELGSVVAKVYLLSEAAVVKHTVKKSWTDMASKGGVPLVLTQMRALANKAAQKALENAGKEGLERNAFRHIFEVIGRKLTQKSIKMAIPVFGALVGGLLDVSQMNKVLEHASIFYHKRFILEKEERIAIIMEQEPTIIDVEVDEIIDEDDT